MKNILSTFILIISFTGLISQNKIIPVSSFSKVTVNPHIQVKFIEGNEESVTIESINVSEDKLNIKVSGKNLNIYLEGAKTVTKSKKIEYESYNGRMPIYKGTVVKVIVTYKKLEALSFRGEQVYSLESNIDTANFNLDIYGASEVIINTIDVAYLKANIYGESILNIKTGSINELKIVSYGENIVKAVNTIAQMAKVTSYGEAEITLNVAQKLKVTSYGEATIKYKGNPIVNKGIVIDGHIKKID